MSAAATPPTKVLVVDNDPVVCTQITGILAPRHCVVVTAESIADGLAAAGRQRFDVCLVDLMLPDGAGTELIRLLRPTCASQQFVVITAFADLVRNEELLHLGAVTVLPKPLSAEQLIDCWERVLGGRLAGAPGAPAKPPKLPSGRREPIFPPPHHRSLKP